MIASDLTFNNMCRVCAKYTMALYSLNENDLDGSSFREKLRVICGIEISETDDYPKKICKKCREKLKNYYEFRKMCLTSQEFLINYNGMEEYLDNAPETNEEIRFFIEIDGDTNEEDLEHSDIEQYFKSEELNKVNNNNINNKLKNGKTKNNKTKNNKIKNNNTKNNKINHKNTYQYNKIDNNDPNKKHKCKYCKKRFLTLLRVKLHMQRLHKEIYLSECKVTCPKCGMKFQQTRNLKRHLVYHNMDSYFGCEFCDEKTYSKKSWRKHIKIHDEKINIICQICNKTILTKLSQIYHMDFHHTRNILAKKNFYVCCTCKTDFMHFEDLEKHCMEKHCLKIPPEHDYLHLHDNNTEIYDEVERNLENIFVENEHNLKKPTSPQINQNINASVIFKCNICHRFYKNLPDLKFHVDDCLSKLNKPKTFMCDVCGKCFAAAYTLNSHKAGHSNARPFVCDVCGQSFKWHNDLTNHKSRIHDKIRPYVCKFCGKRCGTSATLAAHMRSHTGEKPHTCAVCGVGFAQRASLLEHALRHASGTPHECEQCGKLFRSALRLRAHARRHDSCRARYPCELCGRLFSERCGVSRHRAKVHAVRDNS